MPLTDELKNFTCPKCATAFRAGQSAIKVSNIYYHEECLPLSLEDKIGVIGIEKALKLYAIKEYRQAHTLLNEMLEDSSMPAKFVGIAQVLMKSFSRKIKQ